MEGRIWKVITYNDTSFQSLFALIFLSKPVWGAGERGLSHLTFNQTRNAFGQLPLSNLLPTFSEN